MISTGRVHAAKSAGERRCGECGWACGLHNWVMPWERDPVSVWFDPAARRLVTRAYAVKGSWAGVYVGPPTLEQWAALGMLGIAPWQRDRWGEQRWIRALKRSCFHLVNHYGGVSELRPVPNLGAGSHGWHAPVRVQWETGQLVYKSGWPTRRRAVRMRLHAGGKATSRAGLALPARVRWIDDEGRATGRQSVPADPNGWTER